MTDSITAVTTSPLLWCWCCATLPCALQKPLKPDDCHCDSFKPIKLYGVVWRKAGGDRRASVCDALLPSSGEDVAAKVEQIQWLKQALTDSHSQVIVIVM
jgi:hypothetical protein